MQSLLSFLCTQTMSRVSEGVALISKQAEAIGSAASLADHHKEYKLKNWHFILILNIIVAVSTVLLVTFCFERMLMLC